jgi:hypothetical protein
MQLSIVNRSRLTPESRLDSEYYKPQALAAEARVGSKPHWMSGQLFDLVSGPFGSTVTTDKYDPTTNLRYIRGKDVYDFFIDDSDPVHVKKELFERLTQYHLKPQDILVTVVGMNFGKSALIFYDDCPSIFSCKSSLIRNVKINPFYLTAYLSSKYGYALIRRGRRGAAQPGINLYDLENIPIPIVGDNFQAATERLVLRARRLRLDAGKQYRHAEQLLFAELGLQGWKPKHQLTFVRNYTDTSRTQRVDAEHFQPKYQEMFDALSSGVRLDRLGKLTEWTKGIEVGGAAYTERGIPFWRVSNLTKHGLDDESVNVISQDLYNSLRSTYEPKQGEVLLSKDATPGLAYYLEQPVEGISSSGILRLTLLDDIPPHYLELVLNSPFVQLQIEQDAGGSVIKHWKPAEVRTTFIPRLSGQKESQIATLIKQSHAARKQATALLDTAKQAVETAIEQDEARAIEYINAH